MVSFCIEFSNPLQLHATRYLIGNFATTQIQRSLFPIGTSLEQDTGFEPALSAWKADVLAADTNPACGTMAVTSPGCTF